MPLVAEGNDRINQDAQVRTAALLLDSVRAGRIAGIKMCHQRRCQMATCGRTDNANALCIHAPFTRFSPHNSNRPRSILQHCRVTVTMAAQSIPKNERSNTQLVEPPRVIDTFVFCQCCITATGAHNDCRASRCTGVGQKWLQGRDVVRCDSVSAGRSARPKRKCRLARHPLRISRPAKQEQKRNPT